MPAGEPLHQTFAPGIYKVSRLLLSQNLLAVAAPACHLLVHAGWLEVVEYWEEDVGSHGGAEEVAQVDHDELGPVRVVLHAYLWQYYDIIMTVVWQYCDSILKVLWQYHDSIMTLVWQVYDSNMTVVQQYYDRIMTAL